MAKYLVNDTSLTAVADAIRTKGGTTGELEFPGGFISAVEGIQAGGDSGVNSIKGFIDGTITAVSNEEVTTLRDSTFLNCYELVSANFPNVTHIQQNVFKDCRKLSEVNFPKLDKVWNSSFMRTALVEFDLGQTTTIPPNVFYDASMLNTLVIRYTGGVVRLENKNALTGTCFATSGKVGTVFVPTAYISEYQQATNWSALYAAGTCNFVAIEGSEYE